MEDLMTKGFVSAATLIFPVAQPRVGDVALHFTLSGILASMGDRFSTKLISTWDQAPVLHDIFTDDVIGPLEFIDTDNPSDFMKQRATLEIEATSEAIARIAGDHYAQEFNDVQLTLNAGSRT
jgi:hypothetical protein